MPLEVPRLLPHSPLLRAFTCSGGLEHFARRISAITRWHCVFIAAIVAASGAMSLAAAESVTEPEWSADLLRQILRTETPAPLTAAPLGNAQELVLHSYTLTHLRVGEAGRTKDVLAIVGNLLPPGSSLNPDPRANTLHVLTTPAAHKALWDYLSAVDVEPNAAATSPVLPEEVKAALTKVAAAGDQSEKLLRALGALQNDVSKQFADIDGRQKRQFTKIALGAGLLGIVFLGAVGLMLRRRAAAAERAEPSTALALAPDQLASALSPVHERMRSDMLGLLNEVAIKLQAQHNEQQKLVREQQQQIDEARHALADERRQFISEAGTMVVQAVERVDATTAKLAKQQDKVADLVQELQATVRELDETKDNLRHREIELDQERAKIAALSILLEENSGGGAAGLNGVLAAPANGTAAAPPPASEPLCTPRHHPSPTEPTDLPPSPPTPPRFTFLPPDPPQS